MPPEVRGWKESRVSRAKMQAVTVMNARLRSVCHRYTYMHVTPAMAPALQAVAPAMSFARLAVSSRSRQSSLKVTTASRMMISCSSRNMAPPARAAWK